MNPSHRPSILSLLALTVLLSCCLTSPVSAAERDIRLDQAITQGEHELAATLHLPEATAPVAGVVLVHGSGPGPRTVFDDQVAVLLGLDLAVLAYDKRGSGESTGDWDKTSLTGLARDAEAFRVWLADQPELTGRPVGLLGVSQGGWVLPEAARIGDPDFLIVVSGGAMTPEAVERFQYHGKAAHAGAGDADSAELEELLDAYFGYLETGEGYPELMTRIDGLRGLPWFEALGITRVIPKPAFRPDWSWVAGYDPLPTIRRLRAPVLVLLGEIDPLVPAETAAALWRANLALPCIQRVVTIPDAGHGIRTEGHSGPLQPAFGEEVSAWLEAVVLGPAPD